MKQFSAQVNLGFDADMNIGVMRPCDKTKLGHFSYDHKYFNTRVIEFLLARQIEISHFEVFYTPPHATLAIHADGSTLSNIVKINWVFGGKGSRMMWWKAKNDDAVKLLETNIGTSYLYADQKNCVMVESAVISVPTLVNVGQLHSIINTGSEQRWCLSAVLAKVGADENLQWGEAIELLKGTLK